MGYKLKRKKQGTLLIESLVAISVLIIGLLSVISFMSRSLSLNRVVSDQYAASYLAAEGVELVKNIIDSNCLQGISFNRDPLTGGQLSGSYEIDPFGTERAFSDEKLCYDESSGEYKYNSNCSNTGFKREIKIANIEEGGAIVGLKINSIIKWTTRGGGSFSINAEDHFFNWAELYGICM